MHNHWKGQNFSSISVHIQQDIPLSCWSIPKRVVHYTDEGQKQCKTNSITLDHFKQTLTKAYILKKKKKGWWVICIALTRQTAERLKYKNERELGKRLLKLAGESSPCVNGVCLVRSQKTSHCQTSRITSATQATKNEMWISEESRTLWMTGPREAVWERCSKSFTVRKRVRLQESSSTF